MNAIVWFVLVAILAATVWLIARARRQWRQRQEAAEARLASFVAQAAPLASPAAAALPPVIAPPPVAPRPVAPQERLLLEAAAKAGEAGEPVLSIQLYAKLLSRYPQTQFAAQARAAVEAQKKKLVQPKDPDKAARG